MEKKEKRRRGDRRDAVLVRDLDSIAGAEDFLYIRCELFGDGGCTLSQALVIDNGTAPETYVADDSVRAQVKAFLNRIFALRIFVLIRYIIDEITH